MLDGAGKLNTDQHARYPYADSIRFDFTGKTFLVVGASSGIGRELALNLSRAGAEVVVAARRIGSLEVLASEIQGEGGRAQAFALDIVDGDSVSAAIQKFTALDGVVNAAGTNIPKPLAELTSEDILTVVNLNLTAAIQLTQAAVIRMRQLKQTGSLVHISSQMGHVGAANRSVYCASKHGLEGMVKALGVELAPEGIRINTVAPTFVETPLTRPMFEDRRFRDWVLSNIPMKRIGTVADVVGAVLFLLSPAANLITGTSLRVDGGWTAH